MRFSLSFLRSARVWRRGTREETASAALRCGVASTRVAARVKGRVGGGLPWLASLPGPDLEATGLLEVAVRANGLEPTGDPPAT